MHIIHTSVLEISSWLCNNINYAGQLGDNKKNTQMSII